MKYLLLLVLLLPTAIYSQEKEFAIPRLKNAPVSYLDSMTCMEIYQKDRLLSRRVLACESDKVACVLSCGKDTIPCIPVCFVKEKTTK